MKTQAQLDRERYIALVDSAVFNALAGGVTVEELLAVIDEAVIRETVRLRGIAEREALLAQHEQRYLRTAA